MAPSTVRMTRSISSDVSTYTERGYLVAEFYMGTVLLRATGWQAQKIAGLKRGARVDLVGQTVQRSWESYDAQERQKIVKTRSTFRCIHITQITPLA